MASTPPQLPDPNSGSALSWFTTWIVILLMLYLLARSSWGKPIVYYALWLSVAFLILTHYQDFTTILGGGSLGGPDNTQNGTQERMAPILR